MLDTQINMYSVDTGHFYSNSEKYLHEMNCKYRRERNYISNKLDGIKKDFNSIGCSDDTYELIKKDTEYIVVTGWTYGNGRSVAITPRLNKNK